MNKKIVIAGGRGFLGNNLQTYFQEKNYEVKILSRNRGENLIQWDAKTLGNWCQELEGAEILLNMVGRTVDCRYNEKNKKEILSSRIDSTNLLGEAVKQCVNPPKFWFNSSTATIYKHTTGDKPANTESEGIIGDNFSETIAKKWEKAFFSHETPQTIKTALRTAIVMGKDGGAFPVMAKLAKLGLCGKQGSGEQWISWIHISDFCKTIEFLITNPMEGVVNVCVPNPVLNKDFNKYLQKKLKPIIALPQPEWLLEIGAFFIRTETELLLKSRKVYPEKLLQAGFEFQYPFCEPALDDLLSKPA